ncbi:ScbR family autoregulator-binding transcription factor [Streptomyces albidochromogenes]|uniref:ScbR family autoregulator-binding transcription factor n=1 Tax=Streptomyces albidochromogenes TaxID=329524 RepID=A0ABW6FVK4_9ACTN
MAKQERAERTLRRIVTAAAEQFVQHGYAGTSLDDITRAAGVSKGAFYFHFASKGQVATAVVEHSQSLFEDAITEPCTPADSPLQHVIDLTHRLNSLLHLEPATRAVVRFHREWTGAEQPEFDHYSLWYETVGQLFCQAAKRRELRSDIPAASPRVLASTTLFSMEALSWMGMSTDETARRLTDLWDVLLPAITPRGATAGFRTTAPENCGQRELSYQL